MSESINVRAVTHEHGAGSAPNAASAGSAPSSTSVSVSPASEAWRSFRRNRAAMVGLALITAIGIFVIYGAFISDDPFEMLWLPHGLPGDDGFVLGTDYLGRSIAVGMLVGGAPTIVVGLSAAAITMVLGVLIGATAGYFGGRVDNFLMRVAEFFQVMPALLFALVVVTLFSPSLTTITIAIGIVIWPQTARLARAEFLKIRELEYVMAARSIGARHARIMFSVILPNAMPPLVVSATQAIGIAILFEAGLSFLGLGDPNTITWGGMIGNNRQYILDAWWPVTFPGIAIFLTVFAVSLIGDGLNDAFNPRLRER